MPLPPLLNFESFISYCCLFLFFPRFNAINLYINMCVLLSMAGTRPHSKISGRMPKHSLNASLSLLSVTFLLLNITWLNLILAF